MWGHAEGDEVLRVFSAQLRQLMGPKDVIGRLGGDEFAVLLASGKEPLMFQNRLRENLNAWNQQSGKPYNINYSYGVITSSLNKYRSLMEMIKESDSVMYSEKRRKKLG